MKTRANIDIGLLLLRLALGAIFFAHGSQKALGLFGGSGPQGVIGMVGKMGFQPPTVWGWLLIASEFLGSLGILFGFLTPLAALGLVISQGVAVWKVHGSHGFFLNSGGPIPGFEYNVALIGMALCLLFAGPGRYSLDYLLFGRRRRETNVVVE